MICFWRGDYWSVDWWGTAAMPWMAKIGVLLTGWGFAGLPLALRGGCPCRAAAEPGRGAMTYTVFMDMSLGLPAAGGAGDDPRACR